MISVPGAEGVGARGRCQTDPGAVPEMHRGVTNYRQNHNKLVLRCSEIKWFPAEWRVLSRHVWKWVTFYSLKRCQTPAPVNSKWENVVWKRSVNLQQQQYVWPPARSLRPSRAFGKTMLPAGEIRTTSVSCPGAFAVGVQRAHGSSWDARCFSQSTDLCQHIDWLNDPIKSMKPPTINLDYKPLFFTFLSHTHFTVGPNSASVWSVIQRHQKRKGSLPSVSETFHQ